MKRILKQARACGCHPSVPMTGDSLCCLRWPLHFEVLSRPRVKDGNRFHDIPLRSFAVGSLMEHDDMLSIEGNENRPVNRQALNDHIIRWRLLLPLALGTP